MHRNSTPKSKQIFISMTWSTVNNEGFSLTRWVKVLKYLNVRTEENIQIAIDLQPHQPQASFIQENICGNGTCLRSTFHLNSALNSWNKSTNATTFRLPFHSSRQVAALIGQFQFYNGIWRTPVFCTRMRLNSIISLRRLLNQCNNAHNAANPILDSYCTFEVTYLGDRLLA